MDRVWVVHGHDGLDELTTTDVSTVIEVAGGTTRRFELDPAEVGLERREVDEIAVGDPRFAERRGGPDGCWPASVALTATSWC